MSSHKLTSETASYCYLDFDWDDNRKKLASGAAFVYKTNTRYGLSHSDLRHLGGSEVQRLSELQSSDVEWKNTALIFRPRDTTSTSTNQLSFGNRMIVKLYWDVAPMACQNFATLCYNGSAMPSSGKGSKKATTAPIPIGSSGKALTYRNTKIHRLKSGFVLQGGDIVFGNGTGGESALGTLKFKDEKLGLQQQHNRRGLLSMGNSGKNSNTSQFFITFAPTPQCNGKHVVFGEVVSGWDVLDLLEPLGNSDAKDEEPRVPITITDCGVYVPLLMPGSGYWFDQPHPGSVTGVSPVFMVRPRVAIVTSNQAITERFQSVLRNRCVIVTTVLSSEGDNDKELATALENLQELLSRFAVDVILLAPACQATMVSRLRDKMPPEWQAAATATPLQAAEVVLTTKPVYAWKAIQSQSWLRNKDWHFEGNFSYNL